MIEWVKEAANKEFESSPYKTPEFDKFVKSARRWFRAFVKRNGFENLDFHIMHFEFSGFFTDKSGQVWYFSSGDVRFKIMKSMLIRTAKDYKDFTGGQNRFIEYDDQFEDTLLRVIG